MPDGRGDIGAGIHENGLQAGIIIRMAMQQEQAGMGRDADPDLVGEVQTAAHFKLLFRHENLDVPLQFPAIRIGQLKIEWAVRFNDLPPLRRKQSGLQFLSSLFFPHRSLAKSLLQTTELSSSVIAEGKAASPEHKAFIYVKNPLG